MNELTELEKELVSCDEAIQKSSEILNHYNVENTQNNFQDSITELRTDLDDQLRKIRKKTLKLLLLEEKNQEKVAYSTPGLALIFYQTKETDALTQPLK